MVSGLQAHNRWAENGQPKGGPLIGVKWGGSLLKKILTPPPGVDAVKERPCSLMYHKNKHRQEEHSRMRSLVTAVSSLSDTVSLTLSGHKKEQRTVMKSE